MKARGAAGRRWARLARALSRPSRATRLHSAQQMLERVGRMISLLDSISTNKLYFFFIWINVGCLQLNFTVFRAYKPACAEHVHHLFLLLLFLLSFVTNIEASAHFLSAALRDRWLIDHNLFSDFSTSLRVIIWQEDAINTVILIEVL